MKTNDDSKFVMERLVWRFHRSGGVGRYTKSFSEFDQETQSRLCQAAILAISEIPALLYYRAPTEWTLVTSCRLVWKCGSSSVRSLKFEQIKDVTTDPELMRQAGGLQRLASLTILASDGTSHQVPVEPGEPLSGFWNALRMVASG